MDKVCSLHKEPIYSHDRREFRKINGVISMVHKGCDILYPKSDDKSLPCKTDTRAKRMMTNKSDIQSDTIDRSCHSMTELAREILEIERTHLPIKTNDAVRRSYQQEKDMKLSSYAVAIARMVLDAHREGK